jgi:ATP-dependent DNA helicase DinG
MPEQVPDELQARIRTAYRDVLASAGRKSRSGQRQMIGTVARAVANARTKDSPLSPDQFAVIQAPTGSGKGLGYLIGAVPIALAKGLRVVVSVSTVGLQEQLVSHDLAALAGVFPQMKVAIAKGRNRFACLTRTAEAVAAGGSTAAVVAQLGAMLDSGAWDGDVDSLDEHPPAAAWNEMTNDRMGCANKKCASYSLCPYFRARADIAGANVVVVNHALLASDVACGSTVIPNLATVFLVVDEAHRLPDATLNSLAGGHSIADGQAWARQSLSSLGALRRRFANTAMADQAADAIESIQAIGFSLDSAQSEIDTIKPEQTSTSKPGLVRFPKGVLPRRLAQVATRCKQDADTAATKVQGILDGLNGDAGDGLADVALAKLLSDTGRILGRMQSISRVWTLMDSPGATSEPVAKWVEFDGDDLRVCVSPVGVGSYLYDALWSKLAGSAHLSATLCTIGFAPYLRESGLNLVGDVPTLSVASSYAYSTQACLVIPDAAPCSKDVNAHTAFLIENIRSEMARVEKGAGGLVLFSSWEQLRTVAAAMPSDVRSTILCQGDMSRKKLLRQHEALISQNVSSFIFGTSAAMEEGIDLPGRRCELVYMAKLPFTPPTDPVSEALREHLTSMGKDHFREVVMPKALRRLTQGTGRLLRSETDGGRIVVADRRLITTRYGRQMLRALPPYAMASA